MSEASPKPTHRPKHDARPKPRGYMLAADFQPPIKLDRKQGCEFAAAISEYLEPHSVEMNENSWVIKQQLGNTAAGTLEITIGQTSVRIVISFPTHPLEWIEHRCMDVLKEFEKTFDPKVILSSTASYMGTMQIDGDARNFLADRLMKFDPAKLGALNRPVHLLGIRLLLPPFKETSDGAKGRKKVKVERVVDWHVDVKAESLIEDPTQLYLEAEAQWPTMTEWKKDTVHSVVSHLKDVSDYLQKDVVGFLQKSSTETEG